MVWVRFDIHADPEKAIKMAEKLKRFHTTGALEHQWGGSFGFFHEALIKGVPNSLNRHGTISGVRGYFYPKEFLQKLREALPQETRRFSDAQAEMLWKNADNCEVEFHYNPSKKRFTIALNTKLDPLDMLADSTSELSEEQLTTQREMVATMHNFGRLILHPLREEKIIVSAAARREFNTFFGERTGKKLTLKINKPKDPDDIFIGPEHVEARLVPAKKED